MSSVWIYIRVYIHVCVFNMNSRIFLYIWQKLWVYGYEYVCIINLGRYVCIV